MDVLIVASASSQDDIFIFEQILSEYQTAIVERDAVDLDMVLDAAPRSVLFLSTPYSEAWDFDFAAALHDANPNIVRLAAGTGFLNHGMDVFHLFIQLPARPNVIREQIASAI